MPRTHAPETRSAAVELVRRGALPADAARTSGTGVSTLYGWLRADAPHLVSSRPDCPRCRRPQQESAADPYDYLLGMYLGDGCVSRSARGTFLLRITCADAWPGVSQECRQAMAAVRGRVVSTARKQGCHDVQAWWNHWPCLFPQHGPGRKHERPIVLESWQQAVVAAHPGRFVRGLFHSDGWRGANVAVHRAEGHVTRYRYARYEFTNRSDDVRGLCTDALDLLGIAWRPNGAWRISVNRRAAVAALDEHVGPKS